MIIAELTKALTPKKSQLLENVVTEGSAEDVAAEDVVTVERDAIEEIQSELTRLCYERIPLVDMTMHRIDFLPLRQGRTVPMRVQCNGVTVAKVYDAEEGYVLDFGMGVG